VLGEGAIVDVHQYDDLAISGCGEIHLTDPGFLLIGVDKEDAGVFWQVYGQ